MRLVKKNKHRQYKVKDASEKNYQAVTKPKISEQKFKSGNKFEDITNNKRC